MNKKNNFLKKYSLGSLYFIVYVLTLYSLTCFHLRALIEGFIFTAPVVMFILIWACDICHNYEIKLKNFSQKKEENEDLFFIFFALSISGLISMSYDRNNSDLLGWWPYIFFISICFIFRFFFFIYELFTVNTQTQVLHSNVVFINFFHTINIKFFTLLYKPGDFRIFL